MQMVLFPQAPNSETGNFFFFCKAQIVSILDFVYVVYAAATQFCCMPVVTGNI